MRSAARLAMSFPLAAFVSACAQPEPPALLVASRPAPATGPVGTAVTGRIDIRKLIDRLAIGDAPASDGPVYTPSVDTPSTDPRVVAFAAAAELYRCGTAAYPQLLAALDDRRQSIALRAQLPATVGLACLNIIRNQICITPDDYFATLVRTGADGEEHDRPFTSDELFDETTVRAWLAARPNRSLASLQLDATEWALAREEMIGIHVGDETFDAERDIFAPLRRQRDRLRYAVTGGTTRPATVNVPVR